MASTNKLVKPFLKWAGGKRQLVPEILKSHLPKDWKPKSRVYFEPFIGGGALFFALQPTNATISDSNKQLIDCYKTVRDHIDELIKSLEQHENEEEYYYKIRDWDRDSTCQEKPLIEQASRIIFLNKTCFNGLFRVNSSGQFNVPFGRYKNPNIVDEAVLRAVNKYLNNNEINILQGDFETVVKEAKKGDFIYFDPPYDPISNTASFTGYDVNGFNRDDQERLKATFDVLDKKGCYILLSNSYTQFIRDLYIGYNSVKISAIRAINSDGSKRGRVDEILVKNYE